MKIHDSNSALVAGTFYDTASFKLVNSTQPNHQGKCIICTEADCDTVLYKCGHMEHLKVV